MVVGSIVVYGRCGSHRHRRLVVTTVDILLHHRLSLLSLELFQVRLNLVHGNLRSFAGTIVFFFEEGRQWPQICVLAPGTKFPSGKGMKGILCQGLRHKFGVPGISSHSQERRQPHFWGVGASRKFYVGANIQIWGRCLRYCAVKHGVC